MCIRVHSCLCYNDNRTCQFAWECAWSCSLLHLFSTFALRYSLPPFWIFFQFVIPKPFMSIVFVNLCNLLSVFVYCWPSGFSISFHLSLKHPVCVSFSTINLSLQLLRSSHCLCSSSQPALFSLTVCFAVCFMFLYMYLVKQNHSWTRWSYCAPVSCAVTVRDVEGLHGRQVLEPFTSSSWWFCVKPAHKTGLVKFFIWILSERILHVITAHSWSLSGC